MAIKWTIRTEVVNAETDLRKVWATRVDDATGSSQTFFVKGLMKTPEDRKKVWDHIWAQYQAVKTKADAVDSVAVSGKSDLEKREPVK